MDLRRRIFLPAVVVTIIAVACSCFFTYRALSDLPAAQAAVATSTDRIVRLQTLQRSVGTSMSRLRALSWGGDKQDRKDLLSAIARSEQTLEDCEQHSGKDALTERLQKLLRRISNLAEKSDSLSEDDLDSIRAETRESNDLVRRRIEEERKHRTEFQDNIVRQRSEAVWALVVGHGLLLGSVGLLYFARRQERRLRVAADANLLASDERFSLVVRGSADGMALTDDQGRIEMANPALCEMFGLTEDQIKATPINDLFTTTLIQDWLVNQLENQDGQPDAPRSVLATRSDGKSFSAEIAVTPQTIRNHDFLAISVRDVSEREESRIRLKQHEAMLSEIPEPLHILDAVGRIVYWNRGAELLYGYKSQEAIGQTANDLLQVVFPTFENENIHVVDYDEADRWTGELKARNSDGKLIRVERRRTRILEDGKPIGEVVFDLDLLEHKRHQRLERRRQRLESLGTMSSGIAHDLNNLLTPILMSSRMLQQYPEKVDHGAMLDTIARGASRGADLISQLLTFARGGEGQHQSFQVDELLEDISGILNHALPQAIELNTTIDGDLPEIVGDVTEISQVVMNLCINARDAMTAGILQIEAKSLTLSAEHSYSYTTLPPGDYVCIKVTDTGTGIPLEIRERMFDPFFTTKERAQGTGLGLSTSIGIIRSHHGAISVKSTVGEGTTFTVILPLDQPEPSNNQKTDDA